MYDYKTDYRVLRTAAAVDWITLTVKGVADREKVFKRILNIKEALIQFGELPSTWGMKGYKGYKIGHMRWGTRQDSDIVILSGIDAQGFWSVFAPLCSGCSRVDLAVTCETDVPQAGLLETYVREAVALGAAEQRRYTRIENTDRPGGTLYVGSRNSEQFGRIYDKAAEQKDIMMVNRRWRFEVEYKDQHAKKALSVISNPERVNYLPVTIQNMVWWWFDDRNIPPLFDRTWERVALEVSATATDVSKKLTWLTTQVRPTVQELMKSGREADVWKALGLDG